MPQPATSNSFALRAFRLATVFSISQLLFMLAELAFQLAEAAIDAGQIVDAKTMLGYFFWKRSLRKT